MNKDELLKLLVCPACHGPLLQEEIEGGASAFLCEQCQLLYPIVNDIPIMLIDRAIPLASLRKNEK